jgi:hypothetical protein
MRSAVMRSCGRVAVPPISDSGAAGRGRVWLRRGGGATPPARERDRHGTPLREREASLHGFRAPVDGMKALTGAVSDWTQTPHWSSTEE